MKSCADEIPSNDVELREPLPEDWPAILTLANLSVQAIPGAGSQEEWLQNRQRPCPVRRHFVAIERPEVVGYAALESQVDQVENGFRLFLVTSPERLTQIGPSLERELEALLAKLGAAEAWFIEFGSDHRLLTFLVAHGFQEVQRFRLESGLGCVVVSKRFGG